MGPLFWIAVIKFRELSSSTLASSSSSSPFWIAPVWGSFSAVGYHGGPLQGDSLSRSSGRRLAKWHDGVRPQIRLFTAVHAEPTCGGRVPE